MKRRWNGWGDVGVSYEVSEEAHRFIADRVGPGRPPRDVTLDQTVEKVPPSGLPDHRFLDTDAETRVRHAVGQSYPDWVAIRTGTVGAYPDAVAFPESSDDVAEVLRLAKGWGAVVIPYGGGTSVAGHLDADRGGRGRPVISLSLERMTKLIDFDAKGCIATFGAGVPGPSLEEQLQGRGFTLGHYPQSFELSTLGGWVATRSSGHFSLGFGRIEDLFAGGRIETPSGRLDIPCVPASAAGPDLRHFILGSEGRMGVITECTVKVTPTPKEEIFRGAFFPGPEEGRAAVMEIVQSDLRMSMMRLSLPAETETSLALGGPSFVLKLLQAWLAVNRVDDGKCLLLYGSAGSKRGVRHTLAGAEEVIKRHHGVVVGSRAGDKWYRTRFLYPYLRNTLWDQGYGADTLETAVPWAAASKTVDAIEEALRRASEKHNRRIHVFTHHSHVYPHGASIYTSYVYPLVDDRDENLEHWRSLKTSASQAIVDCGGTISHQHGVGHDHAPYLEAEKGKLGLDLLRASIARLDPEGVLATDNLVDDDLGESS